MSNVATRKVFKELSKWSFDKAYDFHRKTTNPQGTHTVDGKILKGKRWRYYLHKTTGWNETHLINEYYRRNDEY